MAKEYSRTQRIGDQMQRELAQLIRREVKDPRVGLVTITAVEVSRDVGHAKIFLPIGMIVCVSSARLINSSGDIMPSFLLSNLAKASNP